MSRLPKPTDYPGETGARDAWILARRGKREPVDIRRPQAVFVEEEASDLEGRVDRVLTVLLTSRECPWRCLMCDLWRHTTADPVPVGAIPAQIEIALRARLKLGGAVESAPNTPNMRKEGEAELEGSGGPPDPAGRRPALPTVIKLYNSGSFLDPQAVPPADYPAIARLLGGFERVIVECHPALVRRGIPGLQAALANASPNPPRLEIAMGLETVHPEVLDRLNKRMTLDDFRAAAEFIRESGVDLRAFVLLQPPFMANDESVAWAVRSAEFAYDCGAGAVSIIPTRTGNGALEALAKQGHFAEPRLAQLEAALEGMLSPGRARTFADTWDLERFSRCGACFPARRERLVEMNLRQRMMTPVECLACGGSG